MHQDRSDRICLHMRLEIEQVIRDSPLNAHLLVRFTDVDNDEVLEDRLDRLRNLVVGDSDEVVLDSFRPSIKSAITSRLDCTEGGEADDLVQNFDMSKADLTMTRLQLRRIHFSQ